MKPVYTIVFVVAFVTAACLIPAAVAEFIANRPPF